MGVAHVVAQSASVRIRLLDSIVKMWYVHALSPIELTLSELSLSPSLSVPLSFLTQT